MVFVLSVVDLLNLAPFNDQFISFVLISCVFDSTLDLLFSLSNRRIPLDLEAVAYQSSIDTRQCINPEQSSAVLLSQAVERRLSPSLCLVWSVTLSDGALERFDCSYPLVSPGASGQCMHFSAEISRIGLFRELTDTLANHSWDRDALCGGSSAGKKHSSVSGSSDFLRTEYSYSWLFRRTPFHLSGHTPWRQILTNGLSSNHDPTRKS